MGQSKQAGTERSLCLRVSEGQLACFFPMLQKGVTLRVSVGCPIGALLREQLGLSKETIETRVQTVFLDGRPVDDIERAVVKDGSTLAIAPAMPGLMGAMLRRGGYYAPMRSGITHRGDVSLQGSGEGRITVKLFGMALRELGPCLLAHAIEVGSEELAQLLAALPPECREGLGTMAELEGQERVVLRVTIAREDKGTRD